MDFVWMGALLALWAAIAAMVGGLGRLEAPTPPASNGGEAS